MDAGLVDKNLLESLESLGSLYTRTGFIEEAMFGFLRMAVSTIYPVATFATYRGVRTFAQLNRDVKDYVIGTRLFMIPRLPLKVIP